jgi:hypothetical protein
MEKGEKTGTFLSRNAHWVSCVIIGPGIAILSGYFHRSSNTGPPAPPQLNPWIPAVWRMRFVLPSVPPASLLAAFSAGLAVVLTGVGLAVLFAKSWLPDRAKTAENPWFRYLPVASAAFIVCIGMAMTWVSLRPPR